MTDLPTQQEAPFQPEGRFAVAAQQDEIRRLHAENQALADRNVYLDAILRQVKEEAQVEIARLNVELSLLQNEAAQATDATEHADNHHHDAEENRD